MKSTQEDNQTSGMLLGLIEPPDYLWATLNVLGELSAVRNGVLLVYSEAVRGRLGIFCNRFISGAVIDGTSQSGRSAVHKLLSAKSGSFLFRPCMPAEGSELKQELVLDIQELLFRQQEEGSVTVQAYIAPEQGTQGKSATIMVFGETSAELPAFRELLAGGPGQDSLVEAAASLPPAAMPGQGVISDAAALRTSYFDLIECQSADRQTERGAKIRKILNSALPADAGHVTVDGDNKDAAEATLQWYQSLIEREFEQLQHDLSKMKPRNQEALVADLQMFQELWKAEQDRVRKWKTWFVDQADRGLAGSFKAQLNKGSNKALDWRVADDLITDPDILKAADSGDAIPAHYVRSRYGSASVWYQIALPMAAFMLMSMLVATTYSRMTDAYVALVCSGETSLRDGNVQAALNKFKAALGKYPAAAVAHIGAALCYAQLSDDRQAEQQLYEADQKGADSQAVLIARAIAEARAGAYEKSEHDCDLALKIHPENRAALSVRAAARCALAKWQPAALDLASLLPLNTSAASKFSIERQLGLAQLQAGNFQAAAATLSQTLADSSRPDELCYLLRADAYRGMQSYLRAVNDYTQALKIAPVFDAFLARGMCLASLNKDDDALEDFGHALQLQPASVEALIQRGSLHLKAQRWQLAAVDLSRALQLNPYVKETQDKLALATAHVSHPKSEQKREAGTTALADVAYDEKTLMQKAYQQLSQGDPEGASDMFAEAVKRRPGNAAARRYLAYCLAQVCDFAAAVAQLQSAAAIEPLGSQDSLTLADCYFKGGDHESAISVLKEIIDRQPDYLPAQAELAKVYYASGFPHEASDLCRLGLAKAKSAEDRKLFQGISSPTAGGSAGR